MAWRSSGSTNASLIANLYSNGIIKSERVRNAMLAVDRAHYSPPPAYIDSPQSIGHAATISAPHMHAHALETLLPYVRPGAHILDIGSGSGYLTHCFAALVSNASSSSPSTNSNSSSSPGQGGKVVGLEHIPALVSLAKTNMSKSDAGRHLLETGKVEFVQGDGRAGYGGEEEWDVVHVGAAAQGVGEGLLKGLKKGGRMFVPVGEAGGDQWIWVIDKGVDGKVERKREWGVRFVPLTDAPSGS